ncbi:MAG TPA: 5'-nucleotidase [Pyrinomonadaceae bacterium]|jgi:2',3'-cyclic-nucleotide 2'-phosphodiesterase (5'-nucleotidase family)|nr:5'-nucleotidase [Pyrinomonadaceae bacterium]
MNQFHLSTPLRIALRASVTIVLCVFLFSVALGQVAQPAPSKDAGARVSETQVDGAIKDDAAVEKMLGAYSPKVRELSTMIGTLKGELRKGGVGAGSLGNFVTDGLLAESRKKLGKSVVLAVTNGGGLRKSVMSEGDIRMSDIWELLPFENALVQFDLTGQQLLALLNQVLSHRDAQSGARIVYRVNAENKPEIVSARLLVNGHEEEIEPQATYTIVSIDYLWKRQSTVPSDQEGNYSVLGKAQKIEPLGLTMRDAMIQYVKDETAAGRSIKTNLDGRFRQEATQAGHP